MNQEPVSTDSIQLCLPATLKYLNVLSGCIAAVLENEGDLPDRDGLQYMVQLAAHELCANIVQYAYAGQPGQVTITLAVVAQPYRLEIGTRDAGEGVFNPAAVPDPDPLAEQGRGLYLMRSLLDELYYQTHTGEGWQCVDGQSWQPVTLPTTQRACNRWWLYKYL